MFPLFLSDAGMSRLMIESRALCGSFIVFNWKVSDLNTLCFELSLIVTFVTNALFVLCLIVTLWNR